MPHLSRKPLIAAILVITSLSAAGLIHFLGKQKEGLLLYGNVDIREVEMAFRQSGRLRVMNYEEGDGVREGDLLAELDDQPFREQLKQAEAQVQEAHANLEKLTNGYRPQEIVQAEELVRQTEAALNFANGELQRQESSVESGATTRQTRDQARNSRDQSKAQWGSAKQDLSIKKEGSRREDIAAATARLEGAKAILEEARTAFLDTHVLAPADAIIQARIREPGSMVGPTSPVYSLALRNPVYLRAYVNEADLTLAVPGASVAIQCDGCSKTYHGTIGFISPRAEFTPKTVETTDLRTDLVYRVRITVQDADQGLRQGMPVTIRSQ